MEIISMSELMRMEFDPLERVQLWKVFPRHMALVLEQPGCPRYWIDLNRCQDSAGVLDWVVQVAKKTWATPEVIGDLVLALNGIFDLQSNYCGFGVDQGRKTKTELRQAVKSSAKKSKRVRKNWNREYNGERVIYHLPEVETLAGVK